MVHYLKERNMIIGKSSQTIWLQIGLCVIALLAALCVGRSVTENAEEGTNRWQNDVVNGSLQMQLSANDRLMAQWCSRDREYIQQT